MINDKLDLLIDAFKSLPGVGQKAAEKMAFFIFHQDQTYIDNFVKRIYEVKKLAQCERCNYLVDHATAQICEFCANPHRKVSQICVVSEIMDVQKIAEISAYKGLFYVIKGEISKQQAFSVSKLGLEKLLNRVQKENLIEEVVIATNPTRDGENTARSLLQTIKSFNSQIKVFRLGMGLPYNCQINYVDQLSLEHALSNKQKMED